MLIGFGSNGATVVAAFFLDYVHGENKDSNRGFASRFVVLFVVVNPNNAGGRLQGLPRTTLRISVSESRISIIFNLAHFEKHGGTLSVLSVRE